MKFLVFALLLITSTAFSQKHKPLYYLFDKDWETATELTKAEYVMHVTSVGDSLFISRIFKGAGFLWRQESFRDKGQQVANGHFAWYDDQGRIDSSGNVSNQLKHGTWTYYDDTLGIYLSVNYIHGKEESRRDYIKKVISSKEREVSFEAEKRELDSIAFFRATKRDEKEAEFKGGPMGFRKYLERNINPPSNIEKSGTVKLLFSINKTGKMEDLLLLRSLQLSADVEAIRVLSEMPDWTPARQDGKNVIYRCVQNLTFNVY